MVELEKPHYIVPEIEAIATDMLIQLEEEGLNVVPCARATKLTMNREGIRRLAAESVAAHFHFIVLPIAKAFSARRLPPLAIPAL